MEDGKIVVNEKPREAIPILQEKAWPFLPEATKLFLTMKGHHSRIPLNVKEAKDWLKREGIFYPEDLNDLS